MSFKKDQNVDVNYTKICVQKLNKNQICDLGNQEYLGTFKLFAGQSYYFLLPSNLLRYHHSIFCQVKSYEPNLVVDLDLIVGVFIK